MRCKYCKNFIDESRVCEYCKFEYDEYYTKEDWDILDLDEDYEWKHLQILNRFHSLGLPCMFADMWSDDNLVILVGCNVYPNKIANALGVHEECIYCELDQAFVIVNLYQEKCIRKGIEIE